MSSQYTLDSDIPKVECVIAVHLQSCGKRAQFVVSNTVQPEKKGVRHKHLKPRFLATSSNTKKVSTFTC